MPDIPSFYANSLFPVTYPHAILPTALAIIRNKLLCKQLRCSNRAVSHSNITLSYPIS